MSTFFSDAVMEKDRVRCEERNAKIAELEAEIRELETCEFKCSSLIMS